MIYHCSSFRKSILHDEKLTSITRIGHKGKIMYHSNGPMSQEKF